MRPKQRINLQTFVVTAFAAILAVSCSSGTSSPNKIGTESLVVCHVPVPQQDATDCQQVNPVSGQASPITSTGTGIYSFSRDMTLAVGVTPGDPNRADVPSVVLERTGAHSSHVLLAVQDEATGLALNPSDSEAAMSLEAFQSRGGTSPSGALASGLWLLDLRDKRLRMLSSGYVGPIAWAPTGKSVAFVAQAGATGAPAFVETVPASGGPPTKIAELPIAATSSDVTDIQWSPNGQQLLISYWRAGSATESGVVLVNVGSGSVGWERPQQQAVEYLGATFSPNGGSVAVLSFPGSGAKSNQALLSLINPGQPMRSIAEFSGQPELVGWF